MVIIGWLRRAVILGAKFDECTSCHIPGPHLLIRKMHWFTLFWIPAFPLWISHGVLCPECGTLDGVSMLGMRRALRSGSMPLGRSRPAFEAAVRDHLGGAEASDWAAFGLEPGASEPVIKARWRELAKTVHPDGGGDAARFVAMQATYQRLLASEGSHVSVRPDPKELFDPVIVNPKKGFFDFYTTKLWPGFWALSIALGALQSATRPDVVDGRVNGSTITAPAGPLLPVQPVYPAVQPGTAHLCWSTGSELNGCQDDFGATMLFGSRIGTQTTCYFVEPLDYGESAMCR